MGLIGDPWGLPMVPEMTNFGKSLFFGLESRTMAQNDPIDNLERLKSYVDRWDPSVTPGASPWSPNLPIFEKSTFF